MDLGLSGKKAIITGASQGIGLETARLLAAEGADVFICGRGQGKLDRAIAALQGQGLAGSIAGQSCDVGDAVAYVGWLDAAAAHLGGVDIFIANATGGVGEGDDAYAQNLNVDVLGLARGTERLLPHLANGGGAVVAVASVAGIEALTPPIPYSVMKTAMISYAAQMAKHAMAHNIRVNSVSPGPIMVEGGSWDQARQHKPDNYQAAVARHPQARLGTPEEVARAIVFLASTAASWITGTNLIVDGAFGSGIQF